MEDVDGEGIRILFVIVSRVWSIHTLLHSLQDGSMIRVSLIIECSKGRSVANRHAGVVSEMLSPLLHFTRGDGFSGPLEQ